MATILSYFGSIWALLAAAPVMLGVYVGVKRFCWGGYPDVRKELVETANKAPETAGRLRKPFIADSYGSGLKGGLDWLDRWLGGRWSGRALFFSVMIALAYAWIAFFGGWAAGFVSGDLMGQAVQPVL